MKRGHFPCLFPPFPTSLLSVLKACHLKTVFQETEAVILFGGTRDMLIIFLLMRRHNTRGRPKRFLELELHNFTGICGEILNYEWQAATRVLRTHSNPFQRRIRRRRAAALLRVLALEVQVTLMGAGHSRSGR